MRTLFSYLIGSQERYFALWGLGIALFVAVSSVPASKLKVKPNFQDLLPQSSIAVQNIKQLTELYGGEGYLILYFDQGSKAELITLAHELEKKLKNEKVVDQMLFRLNADFFKKNSLLYLEYSDLEELKEIVEDKIRKETRRLNPLFFELEGSDSEKLNMDDLRKKYKLDDFKEYLVNDREDALVFLIKPSGSPNDVEFNKALIRIVEAKIDEVRASNSNLEDIQAQFGGMYYEVFLDNRETLSDLLKLSIIAVSLIIIALVLYYRQFKTIIIIAIPLFIGVLANFALSKMLVGYLNLLSGCLTGIIMGLGLDFGIHLYSRYLEEKTKEPWREALLNTLYHTGKASVAGALTTAMAFYGLAFAQFKGFSEFGLIAGNGMLFTALCMMVIFPYCIIFYEKKSHIKFFQINGKETSTQRSSIYDFILDHANKIRWAYFCLILIAGFGVSKIGFEYNFRKIKGESAKVFSLNDKVEKILGNSVKPTVIMTDDLGVIQAITEKYSDKIASGEFKTVEKFQSILNFIPSDQSNKHLLISEVRDHYSTYNDLLRQLSGVTNQNEIALALSPDFIGIDQLPRDITQSFMTEDKKHYFVIVHPKQFVYLDIRDYQRFTEELLSLGEFNDRITIAGMSFVLTEILSYIESDAKVIMLIVIFSIFITCLIIFRHLRDAVLVFISLVSGILFMLASMAMLDVKFNLLNVIVMPIIVGIGIDGGIHICYKVLEDPERDVKKAMNYIYKVIIISNVTTVLGFATLMFAGFRGLKSIGEVTVIGLVSVLLTSLIFLPAFLPLFYRKKSSMLDRRD